MKEINSYVVDDMLKIRPITIEDTDIVVQWRNQDWVKKNFVYQGVFDRETHMNWLKNRVDTGEVEQFIIEDMQENKAIGSVYFRDVNWDERTAEYGIFIGEKDYTNKGYGTMIAKWAVDYAACVMKLNKLFLRVFVDNEAAVKTYQAAGFCQEKYIKGKEKKNVDLISSVTEKTEQMDKQDGVKKQTQENRPMLIMAVHFA